jgi:hypothetical protein
MIVSWLPELTKYLRCVGVVRLYDIVWTINISVSYYLDICLIVTPVNLYSSYILITSMSYNCQN